MVINHDIYDKRLTAAFPLRQFEFVPYSVYFYYVMLSPDNKLRVDHYFYVDGPPGEPSQWTAIPPEDVAGIIPELVANARTEGSNPPVAGSNFEDIVWTRKSHIVILVDESGWSLQKRSAGRTAVAFDVGKGSTPNHSFFDAEDIDVQIPLDGGGAETRSAVAFINHMKRSSDGEDLLDGEAQCFEFNVYLNVDYSESAARPLTLIIDPGGTNLGPPVPPP